MPTILATRGNNSFLRGLIIQKYSDGISPTCYAEELKANEKSGKYAKGSTHNMLLAGTQKAGLPTAAAWFPMESAQLGYKDMEKNRVCPVEGAGILDNKFRRWLQDPQKILRPYIGEGMTVLDLGCGPGFFTIDIAQLVGKTGRVIASDLQDGMLRKLRNKIRGTELDDRIILHKCEENKIGIAGQVDFILAFYMVHEVPDQDTFFREIHSILKDNGSIFIVEPPFHVSRKAFRQTVESARKAGLIADKSSKVFLSKTAILKKDSRSQHAVQQPVT